MQLRKLSRSLPRKYFTQNRILLVVVFARKAGATSLYVISSTSSGTPSSTSTEPQCTAISLSSALASTRSWESTVSNSDSMFELMNRSSDFLSPGETLASWLAQEVRRKAKMNSGYFDKMKTSLK